MRDGGRNERKKTNKKDATSLRKMVTRRERKTSKKSLEFGCLTHFYNIVLSSNVFSKIKV